MEKKKLYRAIMEKRGGNGRRLISDLEDFDKIAFFDKVVRAMNHGWLFTGSEIVEATDSQVETGVYLGMVPAADPMQANAQIT